MSRGVVEPCLDRDEHPDRDTIEVAFMLAHAGRSLSAHVVVLGNEKGGSGKSATAMHVAVALMNLGQRIATIDLDSRQKSFTRYVDNRRAWAARAALPLRVPVHFCIARGATLRLDENESIEFDGLAEAVAAVEHAHDFIVVDTPGTDAYLMQLAHAMADTLITPLNDSFVDLDVLGTVDPVTFKLTGESHYAEMVRDARRQRRSVDSGHLDWIVVRNRLSMMGSRNKRLVGEGLAQLGARLGFARSTAWPSGSSIASSFRAGSPRSTQSTRRRSAADRASPMSPRARR
jgi:chromosome partitioning protein